MQIFDAVTGSEKYLFNPRNVWFSPCSARALQSIYMHTHTFCLHSHDIEAVSNYIEDSQMIVRCAVLTFAEDGFP
jgi:hypothetical protein